MGFLDHSTNNIIVDAVLTDLGRRALARNDGSFQIFQFALGDDEIDYGVIQQFGRTVGREKIEKNTPILEAFTAGSLGLKHKLLSISDEFLTHLPVLEMSLSGTDLTSSTVDFTRTGTTTQTVTATISSKTGVGIDPDILDGELRVELNNLFFTIAGEQPDVVYTDNVAVYRIPADFNTQGDSISSSITLNLKSFSDTTFSTYSVSGGSYIRSFVKVSGINSGLTKSIELKIS
tara:strand:+ start:34 stop:732 length:699 start_codon:yes stop_codon:yes gene_type:complete